MKTKIWTKLIEKYKTEKGIQAFILEGVGMAITVIAVILFLLLLTAVKRQLI